MFWEIFSNLCEYAGKKPNTICKELGLSNATATHWKNGTIPNGEALIKLSEYFGCTTDFLLGVEKKSVSEWTTILNQLSDDSLLKLKDYAMLLIMKQDQAEKAEK